MANEEGAERRSARMQLQRAVSRARREANRSGTHMGLAGLQRRLRDGGEGFTVEDFRVLERSIDGLTKELEAARALGRRARREPWRRL